MGPEILVQRDRLEALRSTCTDLARSREALLERLRNQMGELRLQRDMLTRRRGASPQDGAQHTIEWGSQIEEQYGLTSREGEVALLLVSGLGNAAIASALNISPHTARHHTQHVLEKLGVHSRAEAGARLRG